MEGYLPIKEIGKGSFGIVHLAQRVCDGKIVAMKKILKVTSCMNLKLSMYNQPLTCTVPP